MSHNVPRRTHKLLPLLALCACFPMLCAAALPERQSIWAVLQQLQVGVNQGQLKVNAIFHEHIAVTFHHGETLTGRTQLRAYAQQLLHGDKTVLTHFHTRINPDFSLRIVSDMAVLHGHSSDHYTFSDGLDFQLHSVWSANMLKHEGKWLILSLHLSTNVFDNPLIDSANEGLKFTGMVGFALGMLAAWIFYRATQRRSQRLGRKPSYG